MAKLEDGLHIEDQNRSVTICTLFVPLGTVLPQGPVVRKPISTNSGLNFNRGFLFFSSKAFTWIIFTILYRASIHYITGKKD